MTPDMLPMLTTEPEPRSHIPAPTAREVFHSARTLRSNAEDHSSSVTSKEGAW